MKKLRISGQSIAMGERKLVYLKAAKLYDATDLEIPAHVIRGVEEGPSMFICAGIHGDEINGTEIIRRLLAHEALNHIRGTLIVIPVVNIFGYNYKSRYLPDRRDLNRSFPGSKEGSLASRIAHTFLKEIVNKCDYGIDLHTGSIHRYNIPQIRAKIRDEKTKNFAKSFGIEMVLNSEERDGSLREVAGKRKIKMAVYEGGEALRLDEEITFAGLMGCLRAMTFIRMLPSGVVKKAKVKPKIFSKSAWVRSSSSGTAQYFVELGQKVKKGQLICQIFDLNGEKLAEILSEYTGVIVGANRLPLVTQGEALVHIAIENTTTLAKSNRSKSR